VVLAQGFSHHSLWLLSYTCDCLPVKVNHDAPYLRVGLAPLAFKAVKAGGAGIGSAANDLPVGSYYDLTAKAMDRLSVSSNKKRGLDGRYGRCLALCFADYLLDPCVVLGNVDACSSTSFMA
jgi:hypothetical protein